MEKLLCAVCNFQIQTSTCWQIFPYFQKQRYDLDKYMTKLFFQINLGYQVSTIILMEV